MSKLTRALAALLIVAATMALAVSGGFLFSGCDTSSQYETTPRVRVDSDRTEWRLVMAGDTFNSGGYTFLYIELPADADSITLTTAGPRGYATLEVWPLAEPATAYGTDTLALARDSLGVWSLVQ